MIVHVHYFHFFGWDVALQFAFSLFELVGGGSGMSNFFVFVAFFNGFSHVDVEASISALAAKDMVGLDDFCHIVNCTIVRAE